WYFFQALRRQRFATVGTKLSTLHPLTAVRAGDHDRLGRNRHLRRVPVQGGPFIAGAASGGDGGAFA
ncbi:hypothetical protein AB1399_07895, partial [Hydrogenibacillus schlegelii]|uniref:hypothetical protein n=1 Tax=Hydrogenibacillus schlegelii TaxID=1484 RepID=UPI0034A0019D